jgi:hypothetical protein
MTQYTSQGNINKKIIKKINSYADLGNTSETINWLGNDIAVQINYLYLLNKYKSQCMMYNYNTKHGYLFLNLDKEDDNNFKEISKIMINCIKNNQKRIIVPVTIKYNTTGGHDNVLIYNKDLNILEHFEPHGAYYLGKKEDARKKIKEQLNKFIEILNNELNESNLPTITLVESNIVCPNITGPQLLEIREPHKILSNNKKETTGYCSMWSLLIGELMLKFPTITSQDLMYILYDDILRTKISQEQSKYLKSVIRGFTIYLNNEIEKYFSVLFGEQISFKKIYDDPIKYNKLLNMFIEIELSKLDNPNFNPANYILLYKNLLEIKTIKTPTKRATEKKISILENLDILKNISVTPSSSSKNRSKSSFRKSKSKGKSTDKNNKTIKTTERPTYLEPNEQSPKTLKTSRNVSHTTKKQYYDTIYETGKKPRCPNGTRRNKKTGRCEPK